MKNLRLIAPASLLTLCFLFASAAAQNLQWKPIDPAHVALKAPTIEKDADAEALFWEVHVKDDWSGGDPKSYFYNYIRLKVFTERGVETHGKVDIIYLSRGGVRDIAARTIKPDGAIVELKKDAVFDREIVRLSGIKVKARSFALPAVTPGSIVEYRWIEERPFGFYQRLQFQRDFPIQSVKYFIKPLSNLPGIGMRSITLHANASPFQKEADGFVSTSMNNVPAFHEEPNMPPEDQVRPWMLLYYSAQANLIAEKYWKEHGRSVYESNKGALKVNDDVRRAATEAIGPGGDTAAPDQKLERLLIFVRTKIKNLNDDTTTLSEAERKKLKDNNNPADTLKRGYGVARDIDRLFAALATALGFEARVVNLPDRGDIFFDPQLPDDYFLGVPDIAVKVGDSWKFYDPSSQYTTPGMLPWRQEGTDALLSDPKDPIFIKTPLSPAESSKLKRTAKLKLTEDGTVEGEVRIEYTGHFAAREKEERDEESVSQREAFVLKNLSSRMSSAQAAEIKMENVTDPFKPLVCTYKVRVPGYAERTGKRLFLQPAFFQKGLAARFPNSQRRHDVYFQFPWMEDDAVEIDLPEGYALDNAEAPQSFGLGEVGAYKVSVGVTKDKKTLVYQRQLKFSGMLFPKQTYSELKQVFDTIHGQDSHTITLKQGAVNAAVK